MAPNKDDPPRPAGPITISSAPTNKIGVDRHRIVAGIGYEGDVTGATFVQAHADSGPSMVQSENHSLGTDTRYEIRRLLGEGGMGEVHLCQDTRIGREVAMKVARASSGTDSDSRGRFLREVRVQGQLEHPSVVPVYDLGRTVEGEIYFTMKRIKGNDLESIIRGMAEGDGDILAQYSRRQLLSAVASVCLSVAFAHSRGVIHRDLKPANIMLGDFGEVYVLDWGVAKLALEEEMPLPETKPGETPSSQPPTSDDGIGKTAAGTIMGTPGYMAPEQMRGEIDKIDATTDVFALGAILFEVLALEPLIRGKNLAELLAKSLQSTNERPSERDPDGDIAPELDEICQRATAFDQRDRYQSAREVHDAIEGFLDGERDSQRRAELTLEHLNKARAALEQADQRPSNVIDLEAEAMQELTQALALDPSNRDALRTLRQLLLYVPEHLPEEAELELRKVNRADRVRNTHVAGYAYLANLVAFPLLVFMGPRNWLWMGIAFVSLMAVAGWALYCSYANNAEPARMRPLIALTFCFAGIMSGLFGPLVLMPALTVLTTTGFLVGIRPNAGTRRGIFAISMVTLLVPIALSWFGIVEPWYTFEAQGIVIRPGMVDFEPTATIIIWTVISLMLVATTNISIGASSARLNQAERRLAAQAWRLKKLLPDEAHRGDLLSSPDAIAAPVMSSSTR